MKKQEGFGLIGVLLIISALILTAGGVVVWQKKNKPAPSIFPVPTSPVLPTAASSLPKQPGSSWRLQEELKNIPLTDLYYYYQEHNQEQNPQQKIFLNRGVDEKGVYFVWEENPSKTKMRITQEFVVKFQSQVSADQIQNLIKKENFIINRHLEGLDVYVLLTTEQSKFIDGLRIANYLHENYSTLIDYAQPNFVAENVILDLTKPN